MNSTVFLPFLRESLPRYLAELDQLVNTDSGSYYKAGVDAVGRMLRSRFEEIGCQVAVYPNAKHGDNLAMRLAGRGGKRVLLLGHMDTVFPKGTAAERPFQLDGELATGPGVADMKASLLAACYAMAALRETGWDDFGEITMLCTSDEEIGSQRSRALLLAEAGRAAAVLVLEAARSNGDIVSARKGTSGYRIAVQGKAAHAGVEPEKGASAVHELAHQIVAIQRLANLGEGVTVNVGRIRGGTRSNVVADGAEAIVDVRVPTTALAQQVDEAIREIAAHPTVACTVVTVSGGPHRPPMERTGGTARLVALAQQAAGELGFTVADATTGGASDGNYTSAAGTPTLDGLGPIGGLDHGPDEYVDVPSIVPRTAMLARLITLI